MTTSHRAPGRILRALRAYSAHTAETYLTVWSPATQRVSRPRSY
jgi:hypothetical protein